MKPLQELIVKTVSVRYQNDTDFYHTHGFNVGRWTDFKNGKTDIGNMKFDRVEGMIQSLFSEFEMHLFNQAVKEKQFNWTELPVIERYFELKREAVKSWGDSLNGSNGSTIYGESASNNLLHLYHSEFKSMEVTFTNFQSPAGKRNRREYVLEHLDEMGI